jgi:hypothetical protein
LSEDCHNRLSALALSEVGEDPCGLKRSETSHVLCGLIRASSAAPNFLKQRRKQAVGALSRESDLVQSSVKALAKKFANFDMLTLHKLLRSLALSPWHLQLSYR